MGVGDRIADRFLLRSIAGRGGMGVVYRADDALDGSTVALKLLDGHDILDAARFEREAHVLAELHHPNVVHYIDHGVTPRGHAYLAMEWLEGETAAQYLSRTRPTVAEAVAMASDAAAGLGAAHEKDIVHRDVKPANLFLIDGDPRNVKVLDFGIARGLATGNTLTQSGTVVGTPFYMAPEQARATGSVDPRADVYAVGALLYEALTGRPPFKSESLMAVLAAILMEAPEDVREASELEIPEALAELTMRLLAKNPDHRPRDGHALHEILQRIHRVKGGVGRSVAPPALTEREQRVLCLVLAAGAFDQLSDALTIKPGTPDVVARVRMTVEAHGGRAEILADGSMIARMEETGTPADQAVHAAHCALALRQIAPDLPLAVVAGRGHFQGPIPVGDVIERGSALLSRAVAGAVTMRHGHLGGEAQTTPTSLPVRIDEMMAGLVEGRFEVRETTRGAELGAEVTSPTTARSVLGRRTPCVGRRREVATLVSLYEEVVEEPIARAVLITGPAGIGKSRLVSELLDHFVAGVSRTPRMWLARGDPIAPGSPFGLAAQIVRHACGIREGEPLETRQRKLMAGIGTFLTGPPGQLVAWRLGELAHVPFEQTDVSLPADDPKLRGDAMRDAFLTWIDAVTDAGPLVLVLDDLHWGDRPSLAFLDAALRELEDKPLFVIGAGRPEVNERFGELWAERDVQLIRLARLRPKAAEKLVRYGLGEVDASLISRLVERADGNPFFLEELVRAIGKGEGEEGLPTTVLGMVEARLAELPGTTRRVLRAASVFGRRFWRGGIVELLGGPKQASDIDEQLDVLERRELVDRVAAPRFDGEQELVIRHALTRDAAYAMLTDEDRILGHRLAGAWLEAAGEENALVLAEHHVRGQDDARAAAWLGRAAEQALEGDDFGEAIAHGERAIRGTEDRGSVLVTLADAHRWRGEYRAAFGRAMEAAETVEEGSRAWFRALGVLFAASVGLREHEAADRWRLRAMDADAKPGAVGAQVVALCRAATVALDEGARGPFEATMARAESLAARKAKDDDLAHAWIGTLRASEALRAGDHGAFVDGTEEAVRAYERAGDLRDACNQKVRLGNGYVGLGDAERAVVVLQEALNAARRMGLRVVEGYALQNLGHALLRCDLKDDARRSHDRAIAIARELGDHVLEAGCLLYRTEVRDAGDAHNAVSDAERAVELLVAVPGFRAVARAVLGRVLLTSGNAERALVQASMAAEEARGASIEEGEALVQLVHAEALIANGRNDEASAVAREAVRGLRERADRITDAGWRDAFLHRVPIHARLLVLA